MVRIAVINSAEKVTKSAHEQILTVTHFTFIFVVGRPELVAWMEIFIAAD